MKKHIITCAIVIISTTLHFAVKVQAQTRAACVPDSGYWVIISNKHVKQAATVQFYNNDNQLIYQEQLNKRLKPDRLKTMRCLKRGLDTALLAWKRQKQVTFNQNLVAAILKE